MPNLKKTLDAFLIQYAISSDSKIFSNYLAYTIGVDNKTDFDFCYQHADEDSLRLNPPKITIDKLEQLLEFFHIEKKSYKISTNIVVKQSILFDELMPKFQAYVQTLEKINPEQLRQYQIVSRPNLEKNSLSRICQYIEALRKERHNPDEKPNQETIDYILLLCQIHAVISNAMHDRSFVGYVQIMKEKLEQFLVTYPKFKSSFKNGAILDDCVTEFNTYLTYNFSESTSAIRKSFKEIETSLKPYQINMYKSNIIEHMILTLAGIEAKPLYCKFGRNLDATTMILRIRGLSEDQAKQLLAYLQEQVDTRAYVNNHRSNPITKQPGFLIDDGMEEQCAQAKKTVIKPQPHNFYIDGKAFYERLIPKIFSAIYNASPQLLKPYQEVASIPEVSLAESDEQKLEEKANSGLKVGDFVQFSLFNDNTSATPIKTFNTSSYTS